MSTILRALQRLEGEKGGGGEMGGLGEGLAPRDEPPVQEGGSRWRIGVAACLGVVLLGFFLWWWLPSEDAGRPSAESPPAMAPPPGPRSEPLPRPAPRLPPKPGVEIAAAGPAAPAEPGGVSPPSEPVAAPPPLPPIPEPRALPEQVAAPPPPSIAEPPVLAERVAAPPAPPIVEPAPRVPVAEAPPPAEPPPPAFQLVPQPPVAELPAPEPAPPPAVAEPVIQPPPPVVAPPAPKAPPPARVATVRPPKVTVKKIIWHPTSERRVAEVEVEGRKGPLKLHEGDAVGTLVVSEIRPSAIVFLHGGEELQRKVGGGR